MFKLEGEYVMPKVEFEVYVEAKDKAEAEDLLRELSDWQSKMPGELHDEIHEAKIEIRGGAEDTCWNFAKPTETVPKEAHVVKLPEGWKG